MSIKRILKISFAMMLFIVLVIGIINTIIIYQIKENNFTKELITNLVSMQENMNELLKDITNVTSVKELEIKKEAFIKYELKFESIEKKFNLNDEKDFVDLFISDIYKDEVISTKLTLLYENEKEIEDAFYIIYDLENKKLDLKEEFDKNYPIENQIRKDLDLKIQELKSYKLFKLFSDVKYYSKETLYQYKNQITLNKWIEKIELLQAEYNQPEIDEYKQIVSKLGNQVVLLKQIEEKENELKNKVFDVINQNKVYSSEIEKKIAQLSADFINYTYFSILFLLLIIGAFIIILEYKVYKNIGLSVDEIETKVQEGLEEIKNLNQEIENTQKEVVFTMGAIGESRSKETGNHVKRVAEYSKLLALKLGINEQEAEMLKLASPMHDIGKVGIPDNILNKPGKLTPEEFEIMKTHAQLGYEMLKHSSKPILQAAAIVSKEHHEKYNGNGYPKGLKGEEIHIFARITAVADVFDALGSDRIYKKAWEDEKIFELFNSEKGEHFDPKVIEAFFHSLDEIKTIRERFKDI